jgi:hypothetical protein
LHAADDRPKQRPWRSRGAGAIPCSQNANYFLLRLIDRISLPKGLNAPHTVAGKMHGYTLKEKAKITTGAVTALVIVAWLAIIALALLAGG